MHRVKRLKREDEYTSAIDTGSVKETVHKKYTHFFEEMEVSNVGFYASKAVKKDKEKEVEVKPSGCGCVIS